MRLRERIVHTVLGNVAWALVYVEVKGQIMAGLIMQIRWSLGV
jgi:hypothetical protein